MRWTWVTLAFAWTSVVSDASPGVLKAARAARATPAAEGREGGSLLQFKRSEESAGSSATAVGYTVAQETCGLVSSGPVCFAGQRATIVPNAVVPGLVGHWTFDEGDAVDSSGNGNHAVNEVYHGPSPTGGGHSAVFKKNFLIVPNSWQFQTMDFSYSFWVYYLDDGRSSAADSPRWCPLLRKGVYVSKAEEFANAPALSFSRLSGHLRISVTTSESGYGDGEFVDSNARLMANRWVHLAIVHHGDKNRMIVYVNGIPDVVLSTRGKIQRNEYPLYVGGDPFTADQCEHTVYIDELRAYSRAVAPHEIQAEAAPALAGIDPGYVRLGCLSCSLPEAVEKCPKNRHVCTSLELHTGGYQVAHALGWLAPGKHVWTHGAIAHQAAAFKAGPGPHGESQNVGLGLCCEGEA